MGSHIRRRSKITTCERVPRHPRCAGPRIENWINANIAIAWKVVIYLCDSSAVRVGVINAFTAALREPAKGVPGIVGLFAKVTATSHPVCRYLGIPWGYFGCKQRRGASYTGMCVYTSNCKSVIVWDRVVRVEAFKKVRDAAGHSSPPDGRFSLRESRPELDFEEIEEKNPTSQTGISITNLACTPRSDSHLERR